VCVIHEMHDFFNWPVQSNTLVAPADGHDTTGQVDPAAHGYGPLQVSVSGHPTVLDPLVVNASNIAGDEFFFVKDINDGNSTGFSTSSL
jgi:hypothetical protein